jgi:hypothetical protein
MGGVRVVQERMAALQSAVAEDEASERELELDAQLAEARAIIHEQVSRTAIMGAGKRRSWLQRGE